MSRLKGLAKLINNATKERTPAQKFGELLAETISRNGQSTRKPSKTYKPSSIGGCMRKSYFQIVGAQIDEKEKPAADMVGIWESGSDRHERIQGHIQTMKSHGFDVEWVDIEEFLKRRPVQGTRFVSRQGNEFKMYNSVFNMSFLCDGIIKFEGRYYILEIKTEDQFKHKGKLGPAKKHVDQATCYSMCLGVDQVMFIYEWREYTSKQYFDYTVLDKDKEDVCHYIETCQAHVESNIVPSMTKKQSECKYCSYKEICTITGETDGLVSQAGINLIEQFEGGIFDGQTIQSKE